MAGLFPHSLLDRLIDESPELVTEPIASEDAAFDTFKTGLRRDLEGLLNARKPFCSWLARANDLEGTILDFGLPDLSTEDFGAPAARERIRRLIAHCIRTHEPRLSKVEVESDGGPTTTGVRFRISAMIRFASYDAEVVYDARLRPNDRAIDVALAS
ncbi:type VI secretion system baseplate subunit TssE [soil metagenome]